MGKPIKRATVEKRVVTVTKAIRAIAFPVFNLGQALFLGVIIALLALLAHFSDPLLAVHMGACAYVGIVIVTLVMGFAPDEAEIRKDEVEPIISFMGRAPLLFPSGDRVWAPAQSRSPLFKSDWISINEAEGGGYILKARKRDLRLIVAEIRRKSDKGL